MQHVFLQEDGLLKAVGQAPGAGVKCPLGRTAGASPLDRGAEGRENRPRVSRLRYLVFLRMNKRAR